MRRRPEHGQAVVETAMAMPILVILTLLVIQVGVVVRDRVALTHATREAARAAVVDPTPAGVRDAAVRATGLDPDRIEVSIDGDTASGGLTGVTVTYRHPTDVPLIGGLLPDLTLSERLAVRVE